MFVLIRKLRRIIDWIPTLWNLYDFDYSSIYRVLRKQLERMEQFQREDACALNAEDTADQIRFAVLLLDRLISCDYLENALISHKSLWGESTLEFVPEENGLESLDLVFERADTEKKKVLADKEFRLCGRHADWVEERDKNLLFEYIAKHIKRWWD